MRKHCALKHGIFKEFLAEFLGTFVLVVSITLSFFIFLFYTIYLKLFVLLISVERSQALAQRCSFSSFMMLSLGRDSSQRNRCQ